MNSYTVTLVTDLLQVGLSHYIICCNFSFLKIVNKDAIHLMKATVTLSILPSMVFVKC